VCPRVANVDAARLDVRVLSAAGGSTFTAPLEDGQDNRVTIGYTSLFSSVDKKQIMTKSEGTTGVTGNLGWYTVFQPKPSSGGYHAPKRLRLIVTQLPRERWVSGRCLLWFPS